MSTITQKQLYEASADQLDAIRTQLIVDKMKMDKFFSIFLDESEMDDQDTTTAEWTTYREMLKSYERINQLIKSTDYYISHRV